MRFRLKKKRNAGSVEPSPANANQPKEKLKGFADFLERQNGFNSEYKIKR
jgi:hypothetical protein